jgi:predicted ATP-grasp superfamily ATP-dependent carboligase
MYYTVSKTILQLARENECKLVISSGSISTEEPKQSPKEYDLQGVYGVASTERAKDKMRKAEILELH